MNGESGGRNGPRSNLQSRRIRDAIKKAFPDATITFNQGHYYCSCFVRFDVNRVAYLLTSDYRFFPGQFVVRTAYDEMDFSGGPNHNFVHFENIVGAIHNLHFERS